MPINNKRSVVKTSDIRIQENLEAWFQAASRQNIKDGLKWYKDAQLHCIAKAKKFAMKPFDYAEIISITSVNNKWPTNKKDTETVVSAYQAGIAPEAIKISTYHANKFKAFRVLNKAQTLEQTSPKTYAFSMNVGLNSPDHVTIDKHHLRACVTLPSEGVVPEATTSITPKQYKRVEALTAQLAHKQGLKGYQYQAIIWLCIKEAWNR